MSPPALRRYRAERLLRRDFHALRPGVLGQARRRLAARGIRLDDADLEACYAQAWHGLYATVAAGEPVETPTGWLVTVTVRRAIDEHRQRASRRGLSVQSLAAATSAPAALCEPDPGERLDDLARLRAVFEALRSRLSARECEAASLCYVQGLSRAEAAERMGLTRRRMDKLMDGMGAGAPGVAAKVGELLALIRGGRWCEEQASLMRGLAFGLLDPNGERYRLALVHQRECPACRAYVASLRGLAAVLPPLSLPARAVAGAGVVAGAGGASGASGGWLMFGGSLTAKVTAGCLIALGLGAGCVALNPIIGARPRRVATAGDHRRRATLAAAPAFARPELALARAAPAAAVPPPAPSAVPAPAPARRSDAAAVQARRRSEHAAREFGVESISAQAPVAAAPPVASAAGLAPPAVPAASSVPSGASAGASDRAAREFGAP